MAMNSIEIDARALAEAERARSHGAASPADFSRTGLPDLGSLALRVEVLEAQLAIVVQCLGLDPLIEFASS